MTDAEKAILAMGEDWQKKAMAAAAERAHLGQRVVELIAENGKLLSQRTELETDNYRLREALITCHDAILENPDDCYLMTDEDMARLESARQVIEDTLKAAGHWAT